MPSSNHILPVTTKQITKSNGNSTFVDPSPLISSPNLSTKMTMHRPETLDDPQTRLLIAPRIDEEIQISSSLSRTFSYQGSRAAATTTTAITPPDYNQQRHRRISSESALPSYYKSSAPRRSFVNDVNHAPSETYLITRLFAKLLSYIGVGYQWIMRFLALGCYSLMLMPGFIQVGCYYFFSKQVIRSIVYGDRPRNRLDLYLPKSIDGPKPVVAFVTGGAWIIGYKAWGSLLGKQLSERDIIVACIDYRNFPQATMSDMVSDASEGISFVCNKIAEYGGDPNRIYLMGQSAGAHISACALVEQAIKEANQKEKTTWSVSQIKAYFGLSGGYNLFNLVDYFHSRGLNRSIFLSIMEGEESLGRFSPEIIVQDPNLKSAVSLLPPIILFHGTGDYSIPSDSSTNFAETLKRVGVRAESILYEGKTHTDVFLQDPMRGGTDQMFEDLVAVIHADDLEAQARDAEAPPRKRMVPEFMIQIARKVVPTTFSREHMAEARAGDVKLGVGDGRQRNEIGCLRSGKGWNVFYQENKLTKGDICIFELAKRTSLLIYGNHLWS